jgi:hypothetical protein
LALVDAFALREQPKGPGSIELIELVTDAYAFLFDVACGLYADDDRRSGESTGSA